MSKNNQNTTQNTDKFNINLDLLTDDLVLNPLNITRYGKQKTKMKYIPKFNNLRLKIKKELGLNLFELFTAQYEFLNNNNSHKEYQNSITNLKPEISFMSMLYKMTDINTLDILQILCYKVNPYGVIESRNIELGKEITAENYYSIECIVDQIIINKNTYSK